MTSAHGAYGSQGPGDISSSDWANASWRRHGCGASRWTAFELIAMLLGFIVFWPIGLAILLYKLWARRNGGADLQTMATDAWRQAKDAVAPGGKTFQGPWRGFAPSSGNKAFDEWKAAELARLEEERRRLEEAHREFSEYLDQVRRAKDREEFERFMNERSRKPSGPSA